VLDTLYRGLTTRELTSLQDALTDLTRPQSE